MPKQQQRATHLKELRESIEAWSLRRKGCNNPDLAATYASAADDLRRVYCAIAEDDIAEAAKIAFSLDTIVRGQIPESVYLFLQDETGA